MRHLKGGDTDIASEMGFTDLLRNAFGDHRRSTSNVKWPHAILNLFGPNSLRHSDVVPAGYPMRLLQLLRVKSAVATTSLALGRQPLQ